MHVEVLLYIYGAVCVSMIVFNIACAMLFRNRDDRTYRRSRAVEKKVREQFDRLEAGGAVEERHLRYLDRILPRTWGLMAFDACLERLREEQPEETDAYLRAIDPGLLRLAKSYLKKEAVQSAYFVFILSKYADGRWTESEALMDVLRAFLKKDNLYCKQNAMRALYRLGNEAQVLEGICILDEGHGFFHGKILSDGLLTFAGDSDSLIALLWQALDSFSVPTQVALLNYIRFQSGAYQREMLDILNDDRQDSELRYAAIRYLGKYPYPAARPALLFHCADTASIDWQYSALSASALAGYPGEDTMNALKKALTSQNWYIRRNASASLDALGADAEDLAEILNGEDRYAREMMAYRLAHRLPSEEREAVLA